MGSTKSCPLLLAAAVVAMGAGAGRVTVSRDSSKCQASACAWYDDVLGSCSILSHADRACR